MLFPPVVIGWNVTLALVLQQSFENSSMFCGQVKYKFCCIVKYKFILLHAVNISLDSWDYILNAAVFICVM